jgi:hypothetical protein
LLPPNREYAPQIELHSAPRLKLHSAPRFTPAAPQLQNAPKRAATATGHAEFGPGKGLIPTIREEAI